MIIVCDCMCITEHAMYTFISCRDHYFIFAGWTESSVAMVTWTNRSSDSAVYCLYQEQSWQCEPAYTQTSRGWVELVGGSLSLSLSLSHSLTDCAVCHVLLCCVLQVRFPTLLREKGSILTLASQTEGDDSFIHILEISQVSISLYLSLPLILHAGPLLFF